jgi:hypothetical protein
MSLRNRKRFKAFAILMVGGEAALDVVEVLPVVVVVLAVVVTPTLPNCPVVRVPVV